MSIKIKGKNLIITIPIKKVKEILGLVENKVEPEAEIKLDIQPEVQPINIESTQTNAS
jgi:DnaJ-class molecular chaperone